MKDLSVLGVVLCVVTIFCIGCPERELGNPQATTETADADQEVQKFKLTITIVGQGMVTPASGEFDSGTNIHLSAVAASGWQFFRWTSSNLVMFNSGKSEMNFQITSNVDVTAEFFVPEDDADIAGLWKNTHQYGDLTQSISWDFESDSFTMTSIIGDSEPINSAGTFVTGVVDDSGWRPIVRSFTSSSAVVSGMVTADRYKFSTEKLVFESNPTLEFTREATSEGEPAE